MTTPNRFEELTPQQVGTQGELLDEYNKIVNNLQFMFSRFYSGLSPQNFQPNEIAVGSSDGTLSKVALNKGDLVVGGQSDVERLPVGERGYVVTVNEDNQLGYERGLVVNPFRISIGV